MTTQELLIKIDSCIKLGEGTLSLFRGKDNIEISEKDSEILEKNIRILKEQKRRIEKSEINLVVTGLEKSGKSSFINSLIGIELIPNASARCTYTVSEIEIKKGDFYFKSNVTLCSPEVMEETFNDIINHTTPEGGKYIEKNIENSIKSNFKKLKSICSSKKGNIPTEKGDSQYEISEFESNNLKEVRKYLECLVANPIFAVAVNSIKLEINTPVDFFEKLDKLTIIDTPGIDSGLELHKKIAIHSMSRADCVIFVQDINNSNINESAQELVTAIKSQDSLPIYEKSFVFASKADGKNQKLLSENFNGLHKAWTGRKYIQSNRIILGSSGVALLKKPKYATRRTIELVTGKNLDELDNESLIKIISATHEKLREEMEYHLKINGYQDATGVNFLKSELEKFYLYSVKKNTENRIFKSFMEIENSCKPLIERIEKSDDYKEFKRNGNSIQSEIISNKFKKDYMDKVISYTNQSSRNTLSSSMKSSEKFSEKINEKVEAIFDKLPLLNPEKIKYTRGEHLSHAGENIAYEIVLRKESYLSIIKGIRGIGDDISQSIYNDVMQVVSVPSGFLWQNKRVEDILIEDKGELKKNIDGAVQLALSRVVDPILEGGLRYLRCGTYDMARKTIIRKNEAELKQIQHYYSEKNNTNDSSVFDFFSREVKQSENSNNTFNLFKKIDSIAQKVDNKKTPQSDNIPNEAIKLDLSSISLDQAENLVKEDVEFSRDLMKDVLFSAAKIDSLWNNQVSNVPNKMQIDATKFEFYNIIDLCYKNQDTKESVELAYQDWMSKNFNLNKDMPKINGLIQRLQDIG